MDAKSAIGGMQAAPRVLGRMLGSYVNQNVRITGRVQPNGMLLAPDGVAVHVIPGSAAEKLHGATFVEIVGKVNPDMSIQAYTASDLGTNLSSVSVEYRPDALSY